MTTSLFRFVMMGLLATFSLACGGTSGTSNVSSTQGKIINGFPVNQTDAPQILQLLITGVDGTVALCSGTAIGREAVLSAGHCFRGGAVRVELLGSDRVVVASKVVIHPGYTEQETAFFNDVAVVHTGVPHGFPLLGLVQSIAPQAGQPIGIWGYGLDEAGQSGQLRHGEMILDAVTPNHLISVFDDSQNTCSGDSGGPATYTVTDAAGGVVAVGVVGVTSTGSVQDCSEGDLSLFTNLQNPDVLAFLKAEVQDVVVY